MKYILPVALCFMVSISFATSYKVKGHYPEEAIKNCIEGWVKVRYTVSDKGRAESIEIIAAEPPGVFESAAKLRVRDQKFEPRLKAGRPVSIEGVEQVLNFKLSHSFFPQCGDS